MSTTDDVLRLVADGLSYAQVGQRLGLTRSSVGGYVFRAKNPDYRRTGPRRDWTLYPCGHPRTADNTRVLGVAGPRCRICRNAYAKEWERKHRSLAKAASQ